MATEDMNELAFELKKSLPNKLLNKDGSVTDFQGNEILPADKARAEVFERTKSIANKFADADGETKTYAQISLELFMPVEQLPETGNKNKIYLVPTENGMFDEYYWNDNDKWDKIGEVSIDLSKYMTADETKKYVDSQVKNVLGGEY